MQVDKAIREKNTDLYQSVVNNEFDFSRYFVLSRLPKQQLIENVVELERHRTPFNVTRLKQIAAYIRDYNATYINHPLAIHFDEGSVLKMTLEAAIAEKLAGSSKGIEDVTQIVRQGIAIYYFDNLAERITRSGNLRLFFEPGTSYHALIEKDFAPSELLLGALSIYCASKSASQLELVVSYIRDSHLDIPSDFIAQIVALWGRKSPYDLYADILFIEGINAKLATALFQLANDTISTLFSPAMSFEAFASMVEADVDSPFKRWFITRLKAQDDVVNIKFNAHIEAIVLKSENLTGRGFDAAARCVDELVRDLKEAQTLFLQSNDRKALIMSCNTAIDNALDVLGQHRGIKKFLAPIVKVILSIARSLNIISDEQKNFGFFKMSTDSAQKVMQLKSAVLKEGCCSPGAAQRNPGIMVN